MSSFDTEDTSINTQVGYYKPKNKKERDARRRIWDRFRAMADDPIRKEEEADWERADKTFMQWMPEREPGDWRAHIALPDAFAAVQTHMQETVDRRSRPYLEGVENSDLSQEMFVNSIMSYSMDRTGYDYQTFLAKQCAAIRGTAFQVEYYRVDKREIMDPVSVNDDGTLKYQKKEVIDFDDTYTEYIENEYIYTDPDARSQDMMKDYTRVEVLEWNEFQRVYGFKEDFMNVEMVPKAGDLRDINTNFFKYADDMTDDDVQILHYENRSTDSYDVLANNVLIRLGPLPTKHKELSLIVRTHYKKPGRIYGMGIPKVIYSLTEERKSLRNLNLDRQNMQINKMFLVNDLIDLDEEELRTRPNGFINVNSNGMALDQTIRPIEYGDTPVGYYKAEEMLLEDIRRAHGINDQSQGNNVGGTATEAAILKEAAQKRINLINVLGEMEPDIRVGKLKWSNIQFFYPAPRIEKITIDNEEKIKKVYRRIKTNGQEFTVVKDDESGGQLKLRMSDIDGSAGFKLDKTMARFMEGDWDVVMKAGASAVISKPLQQAKITEMFGLIALNPQLTATIDPDKAVKRYLVINDEDPKDWMRGKGLTETDWRRLALHENDVMAMGQTLAPTEGATEQHTEEHLNYMQSADFQNVSEAVKQIFLEHIMGEHENNPNTGSAADALAGAQGSDAPQGPGGPSGGMPDEQQVADLQPSTPGGANNQDTQREQVAQ